MVDRDDENDSIVQSGKDQKTQQPAPNPAPPDDTPANLAGVDRVDPEVEPISTDLASEPIQEPLNELVDEPVSASAASQKQAVPAAEAEPKSALPEDPASVKDAPTKRAGSLANATVLAESRKHTRRSFAAAALATAAGYGFYYWLPRSAEEMAQPKLLRRMLMANAALSRFLFDERGLAPTYAPSRAETLRVNGVYGLKQALIPQSWRLQLVGARDAEQHPRYSSDVTAWEYRYADADAHPGHDVEDQGHDTKVPPAQDTAEKMAPMPMMDAAKRQQQRLVRMPRGQEEAGRSRSTLEPGTGGLLLTIEDVTKLPRHELVTQFKCIEGWSQIVHWAGVRMADFLELYPPKLVGGREPRYVYMETPNGDYYTGYDMHVMRHPQTLLVTEMMGAPLTQFHGAPLRLHMPTKYGYKQIKRIGLISYTDDKPDDYWTRLGYDWYAGL